MPRDKLLQAEQKPRHRTANQALGVESYVPSNMNTTVNAKAPLVVVENKQRSHSMGLGWERAQSIFSSAVNGCYHADPFFGHDLQPGQQRRVRGRIYLIKGQAMEVLQRFREDFPAPP